MSGQTRPAVWERFNAWMLDWGGYALLAAAFVLSLSRGFADAGHAVATVALTMAAAAWIYVLYGRIPEPRRAHRPRVIVFYAGLLVIGAALMLQEQVFFVFLISGFIYALLLRPFTLMVVGVGATSVLINTLLAGIPSAAAEWQFYVAIIVVQTIVISAGLIVGERVAEQNDERREMVAQLEAALDENAGLHAQLVIQAREAGVLEERTRMASEIHDTIAQGLIGIVTQLEALRSPQVSAEDRDRRIDNAQKLARWSLVEARRSFEASLPAALESVSLPQALDTVARDWSAINSIPVEVKVTGNPIALNQEIEIALLRTAQEALANVARHSHATRAALTLSFMGDVVTLDVRDDGVGFDASGQGASQPGFGLSAMRRRIARVAGSLAIESEPGAGTALSARVPAIAASASGASVP